MEKCSNCGRSINDNEKAYIYQGKHIVCGKCYVLLIDNKKQTKGNLLPGTSIAGVWNAIGVVYGGLTCLVVFVQAIS